MENNKFRGNNSALIFSRRMFCMLHFLIDVMWSVLNRRDCRQKHELISAPNIHAMTILFMKLAPKYGTSPITFYRKCNENVAYLKQTKYKLANKILNNISNIKLFGVGGIYNNYAQIKRTVPWYRRSKVSKCTTLTEDYNVCIWATDKNK